MNEDDEVRARVDVQTPWFKLAVDKIDWKEVLVVAMVLATVIYLVKSQFPYDGPVMVSTGVDSRDGNTVGDDRKSSKTSKCKSIYIQALRS